MSAPLKLFGLPLKIRTKVTPNINFPVDVNFGSTSHTARQNALKINPIENVTRIRNRATLSKLLNNMNLKAYKCNLVSDYFDNNELNIMTMLDEFDFPFIISSKAKSNIVKNTAKVLSLYSELGSSKMKSMYIEKMEKFDEVLVLYVSPWLNGKEIDYLNSKNSMGLIYSYLMPRSHFFSGKKCKEFTGVEYTGFMRPANFARLVEKCNNMVSKLGLDFAEINIGYDRENNRQVIIDVKTHIKFDYAKNKSKIASIFSSVLEDIIAAKIHHNEKVAEKTA